MYSQNKRHVHFVGIGGIGMSGVAEVLLAKNYQISGSDLTESDITRALSMKGATISYGHCPNNVKDADVVVISSAVNDENLEIMEAWQRGIPIIPRAEMLGELMKMKSGIAIAGTHGKTTTTSMASTIIAHAGLDPTIIIGGKLNSLGSNAKLGAGEFLVAEADESDKSFLKLPAVVAVVTNIDNDHLDHYDSIGEIKDAFIEFINKIPFYGRAILCMDDANVYSILSKVRKPYFTYGFNDGADLQAIKYQMDGFRSKFYARYRGRDLGEFECKLPGKHMVLNSLAAIGVALEIGIPVEKIREGLAKFSGVRRRFEVKHSNDDLVIVDDYGHHPNEIVATLGGIRPCWAQKIVTLFQPHRFSRTRDCYDGFLKAFSNCDELLITDIYPAGERPIPGISAKKMVEDIQSQNLHPNVSYVGDLEAATKALKERAKPGSLILTMGAGYVYRAGDAVIEEIS